MDLDYDAVRREFSLQSMSIVTVVHEILDAVGYKRKDRPLRKRIPLHSEEIQIEKEALERISMLKWPTSFKESAKTFVRPMLKELLGWHQTYDFKTRPILTYYGAIDVLKTMEDVYRDEALDKGDRFLLACRFCNDEYILKLGRQLSKDDIKNLEYVISMHLWEHNVIPKYWLKSFERQDKEPIGECLPQEVCDEAILSSFLDENDVAAKYLIPKASPEILRHVIMTCAWNAFPTYRKSVNRISPSTWCLLFLKANSKNDSLLIKFAHLHLLQSLLRWPYQKYFIEAVKSSIKAEVLKCSDELSIFVDEMSKNYEDWDNHMLLSMFTDDYRMSLFPPS